MDAPNQPSLKQTSGTSSSGSDQPSEGAKSSADTDARTFIHKTQSSAPPLVAEPTPGSVSTVDVGSKLGPYELVRKLGQGGMGAVFEVRHVKLKKTFALKVLPPGFAANAAGLSRFEREMEAVGSLDHPNIVKATNADVWNGTHYLVMDYVEGMDLSVRVKTGGTLSVPDACDVIRQAALGLAHAHEHGLVHRDIKPSNLFVARSSGGSPESDIGTIKLLDLGLARLEQDEAPGGGLTTSGQVLGTPDYMAPEQWDDTHSADARADLYSLGCTLFFVLTGKAPFAEEGAKPSVMRLMRAHNDAPIPDLLAMRPDVPAELNAIYRRLLAKKPEDRFQTAVEVAKALEPFKVAVIAPRDEPSTPSVNRATDGSTPTDIEPSGSSRGAMTATLSAPALRSGSRETSDLGAEEDERDRTLTSPATNGVDTKRRLLIGAAFFGVVVLFGIVIKITMKDGSTLEITVPADVKKVEITNSEIENQKSKIENPVGWHGWPADAPAAAIAPFDAEQAKEHQRAWAEYLKLPVEYTNSLDMKFVLIPPGEFTMGSTPEEVEATLKVVDSFDVNYRNTVQSEVPRHKVMLTKAFYLGTREVTQKQYQEIMGTNPSAFGGMNMANKSAAELAGLPEGTETSNFAVDSVSWNDAAEFCAKLSKQEKLKPFYFRAEETVTMLAGTGFRLPTEAEWEFACRAGTTTKFWNGDNDDLLQSGWFDTNSGKRTHEVGELKPNPFGLYDVHGNVWEWVQDWWEPGYYDQFVEQPAIDPPGAPMSAASQRVSRGGDWYIVSAYSRASNRHAFHPATRTFHYGFRVSLPADAVRQVLKLTGPAMPKAGDGNATDARRMAAPGRPSETTSNTKTAEGGHPTNATDAPIDFAAERTVAERLLRLAKGKAILGNKDRQPIGELKEPLPGEPFCILSVDFANADVNDDDLAVLAGCRELVTLRLTSNPKVTAAGLKKLEIGDRSRTRAGRGSPDPAPGPTESLPKTTSKPDQKGDLRSSEAAGSGDPRPAQTPSNDRSLATSATSALKELFIDGTGIGDDGLPLLANFPSLAHLDASRTPISGAGWETLAPLPRLRRLATSSQVGDAGLRRIVEQCPELRELSLWDESIVDLTPIVPLTRLRWLHGSASNMLSEAGINTLLKLPLLDELHVSRPDAPSLERLRQSGLRLTRLHLRHQGVGLPNSESWASVTAMTELHDLQISDDIAVDGPALQRLAKMPRLQTLSIRSRTRESSDGNDTIAPNPRSLTTSATQEDIATFRRARPEIEFRIDGQSFPALSDWPGKFEGSTSIADWTELGEGAPAPAIGTFSPEVAKQRQEEWAKHLKQPVEVTLDVAEVVRLQTERPKPAPPKDGTLTSPATKPATPTIMKFRLIPPSEAVVNFGTSWNWAVKAPEQLALQRVEQPYYLGTTEVTVGQFKQFVEATGYVTDAERLKIGRNLQFQLDPNVTWKTPGYAITDDLPVNIISPADAQAFCAWLNEARRLGTPARLPASDDDLSKGEDKAKEKTGKSAHPTAIVYRLPTELEWERACRAGGAGDYGFAGNAPGVLEYAWLKENTEGKPTPVQPVATKRANPFGLYDVLGNVWEWPTTGTGLVRGVVGVGFDNDVSSISHPFVPGTQYVQPNVGFRVLRQVEPSPAVAPPKFAEQPVLVPRHTPLGPQANVTRPTPIPGLRSWTIELAGHQSHVTSIAWSPQGDLIATTCADMTVRLWDRNGNLKSILLGHAGGLQNGRTVSFSADGTRLATVDMSNDMARPSTLRIWEVSGSTTDRRQSRETPDAPPSAPELSQVRLLASVPLRGWGWEVVWSPDGQKLAYAGPSTGFEIMDLATGQASPLQIDAHSLAWSADSRTLCAPEKWLPTLFDVASGEKLATLTAPDAKPDEALASRVAWSPDGRWLAGAQGKQVRIWDAATRKHLRTMSIEFDAVSLAWHKDSQLLAITTGDGGKSYVLNTKSGEIAAQSPHIGNTPDIAWSPDGAELVVHSGVLHFLDGKTGKLLRSGLERGQNHFDREQPTFLSADGQRFYAKHDARLEFDAETGQLLERRKTPNRYSVATAPDERWWAYSKSETELVIEPKRFDRDPATIKTPGMNWYWRSDPSGERIAQAFGQQVLIWDASTGQPLGTLPHPAKLWSFEWSPNGQQLATAADDKTIRVWDTKQHKLTAEFKQFPQELGTYYYHRHGSPILAWTRDGRSLWIPLGQHAGLLDLSTGRVAPVENFSNGNAVGSLTLASDGDRLLVRESERTFLRDRDGSRQLLGQHLGIRPQWHPDSRRFLSGNNDYGLFGVRGFDVTTRQRLGTLWPVLTDHHWLCIGPTGHYRGSPNVEDHIVYVAQLDNGSHLTLSPAEFAKRFAWQNDPEKATLLKLSDEQ